MSAHPPDCSIYVLREFFGSDFQIDWDFQERLFRAVPRRGGGEPITDPEEEGLWKKLRTATVLLDIGAPP